MSSFRDLVVWQKSMNLVESVYVMTKTFPDDEKFNLVSQIRRCAVSVPSNIAEGQGRRSNGEFGHFLKIAYGSCTELETQIEISRRLDLISENDYNDMQTHISDVQKMLNKLISSIKSSD